MHANSLGIALLGGGPTTLHSIGPLLARDPRFCVKAVYAFGEEEARALSAMVEDSHAPASSGIGVFWGSDGLARILERPDVALCTVDIHPKLLHGILPKLWAAGKHVLSHCLMSYELGSAQQLVDGYSSIPLDRRPCSHVLEANNFDGAFPLAGQ